MQVLQQVLTLANEIGNANELDAHMSSHGSGSWVSRSPVSSYSIMLSGADIFSDDLSLISPGSVPQTANGSHQRIDMFFEDVVHAVLEYLDSEDLLANKCAITRVNKRWRMLSFARLRREWVFSVCNSEFNSNYQVIAFHDTPIYNPNRFIRFLYRILMLQLPYDDYDESDTAEGDDVDNVRALLSEDNDSLSTSAKRKLRVLRKTQRAAKLQKETVLSENNKLYHILAVSCLVNALTEARGQIHYYQSFCDDTATSTELTSESSTAGDITPRFSMEEDPWRYLRVLKLTGMQLREIPNEVLHMQNLCELWLDHNKLNEVARELPTESSDQIAPLTKLRELHLAGNVLAEETWARLNTWVRTMTPNLMVLDVADTFLCKSKPEEENVTFPENLKLVMYLEALTPRRTNHVIRNHLYPTLQAIVGIGTQSLEEQTSLYNMLQRQYAHTISARSPRTYPSPRADPSPRVNPSPRTDPSPRFNPSPRTDTSSHSSSTPTPRSPR